MTEAELIKKIQGLKSIKPRKDWVVLTKNQIFSEELTPSREVIPTNLPRFLLGLFQYKYALASFLIVLVLGGAFVFAQEALPGDILYSVKKVTERARLSFVSEEERPSLQLEYANERLETIVKVVEAKKTKKLAPIIEEYQANVSEAAKSLTKVAEPNVKEIVQKTKKLEENKQKIEASLGIVVGEIEELDIALAQIVEEQIEDLEGQILSERQEELLEKARENYQEGNYSKALEIILFLSYPQEK